MGWRQDNPEQLQSALNGSAFVIAAFDKGTAIAMARLIWDGGGGATIPGIQISPEYHNEGIETELVGKILEWLREKLKPGFGIQVDIRAFGDQEFSYERLGFQISTTEKRGIPMHICLTDQIELTDKMFKQMGFEE
jgi:GNAT superfamily N-acetyltransferase